MAVISDGKFTKIKKFLVGISGAVMLFASINLSKEGVGFTGDAVWIGIAIAVSLSCAEFMFNSNFEDMNWTILVIGIGAYIYSILTNIAGFYSLQGLPGNIISDFNLKALLGGIFMDVYPELAIAWALKESKVGDLLGNILKTFVNPENMTEAPRNNQTQRNAQVQTPPQSQQQGMSRRQQAENNHRNNPQNQGQQGQASQNQGQGQRSQNPNRGGGDPSRNGQRAEPTYHPIGMSSADTRTANNGRPVNDLTSAEYEV